MRGSCLLSLGWWAKVCCPWALVGLFHWALVEPFPWALVVLGPLFCPSLRPFSEFMMYFSIVTLTATKHT